MSTFSEERDYLARAQLPRDPFSFEEVVKEAFLLEHHCAQQQDIARVLGVDKSRISQIFSNPKSLKPETIQSLLTALKNPDLQRRIVRAWMHTCFGSDIDLKQEIRLTGKRISEKTLSRVDRQIRESRFNTAAKIALEGAEKTDNWELRQRFLDRAYFAHHRLDELGQAMRVARLIVEGGRKGKELRREAAGHWQRVRTFVCMGDSGPAEVDPIFAEMERLLAASPPVPDPMPLYGICTERMVSNLRFTAYVTFMKQGTIPLDRPFLEAELERLLAKPKKRLAPGVGFRDHRKIASIYLLLGQTFAAQEHIDAAFNSGETKNLQAFELCGLLKGKAIALTEPLEVASAHFMELSRNCEEGQDFFHRRLSEWELARVENERCR